MFGIKNKSMMMIKNTDCYGWLAGYAEESPPIRQGKP